MAKPVDDWKIFWFTQILWTLTMLVSTSELYLTVSRDQGQEVTRHSDFLNTVFRSARPVTFVNMSNILCNVKINNINNH